MPWSPKQLTPSHHPLTVVRWVAPATSEAPVPVAGRPNADINGARRASRRAAARRAWDNACAHTAFIRSNPDFLIIGAQRCGTTALHNYLASHPNIYGAAVKEVHYFDLQFHRGSDWYQGHFANGLRTNVRSRRTGSRVVTGEATPYYLFHPDVPGRVKATMPDVKLIVLLRDPVARAFSQYNHEVALGFEQLPFAEALDAEAVRIHGSDVELARVPAQVGFAHRHSSYVSRGLYAWQLQRWLEYFPREQIHVAFSEDFYRAPEATTAKLLKFLDVSPMPEKARFQRPPHRNYPAIDVDLEQRRAPRSESRISRCESWSAQLRRGAPMASLGTDRITVPFVDLSRANQPVRDGVLNDIGQLIDSGRFINWTRGVPIRDRIRRILRNRPLRRRVLGP